MSKRKNHKTIHQKEYHLMISFLRELRENRSFTQKDLADKIGCDQTFISKTEIGERRLDVIELMKICTVLNISTVDFLTELEIRIKTKIK